MPSTGHFSGLGRTINLNAVPNENLVFVLGNKTGSASVGGVQTFVSPPQIYVDIRTRGDFGNTCLTATSTTTGEFNFYGIFPYLTITICPDCRSTLLASSNLK